MLLFSMYIVKGPFVERQKETIGMKAQSEFHKENRKNRKLELKVECAKQKQAINIQKIELQASASEAHVNLVDILH